MVPGFAGKRPHPSIWFEIVWCRDDLDAGIVGEILEKFRIDIIAPIVDVDGLVRRGGLRLLRVSERRRQDQGAETQDSG